MTQWYVKDISRLTGVSVQTLHHYDRINLLKPSVRLANGYRLYSEKDLLKLQQIIALKFFGFGLSQIKTFLAGNVEIADHFSLQAKLLEEKAKNLLEASQTLQNIMSECSADKSIPWETIIKLIEVYRMIEQLEKTWAGKVLTQEELKQYANIMAKVKAKYSESEQKVFEDKWINLIEQIGSNLDKDPKSEFGSTVVKQIIDLSNSLYGKEFAGMRYLIWEKGYKKGQMDPDAALPPEIVSWLDKAAEAYYKERFYNILDKVGSSSSSDLSLQLSELMTERYGDSQRSKQDLINVAMKDSRVSDAAKNWLKQFSL